MQRPITQADKDAMADLVVEAARRLLRPDAGVTLSGQPVRSFLAGSAPSTLWSKIQWDIGRETCRRWAAGKSASILPQRESFLRDTCSPYISGAFGAIDPARVSRGFSGGQCAGVAYNVSVRRSPSIQDFGQTLFGPIGNFSYVVTGSPTFRLIMSVPHRDGVATSNVGQPGDSDIATYVQTAVRVDGLPDTCGDRAGAFGPGNPASGVPAPAPIPSPPGMPWLFPGVNVTLNPDGTITISFGDGTAPVTIDPGFEPSFPSLPPPGGGAAGTPASTGVGGTAEGDAPSGKMLWGIKVTITTAPGNANQFSPGIYRGVCYVYMGDANGLDNDPAGAAMSSGQMVLAERDYLTKWRVVANDGYNLSVTPYYKNTEA